MPTAKEPQNVAALLKSARGESINFRQFFELLGRTITHHEGTIVSTMPRGTLQTLQPPRLPEQFLKGYARDFHLDDRPTWQAILKGQAIGSRDIWVGAPEDARYVRHFMVFQGARYVASAPLAAPLFDGYPGALHLYRSEEQGDFGSADLRELKEVAAQLDLAIERVRNARRPNGKERILSWSHRPSVRIFVLDGQAEPVYGGAEMGRLDERLRNEIVAHARHQLERLDGDATTADRMQFPDSRGDLWTFRVVTYARYPAIGEGVYITFCLVPECQDWAILRPTDFGADAEMARLSPALRFMNNEFHRSPTLNEISKVVNLSPFHFHRRFTELFGLTPKHYLLECQVQEAKKQLVAQQKVLAKIATDCGFAHQSHFTSRFKQATGLTPTRWRRAAMELR